MLLQLAARATPSRSPLFPPPPMENLVSTWHFVRIAANLMPLTPLVASSGNIVLTISGLWNDMQRWMSSNLMHILLLEKLVPAAKPRLQGVVVEMVGRRKPIRGDLNLFSVQDYPCRYGPCPVACNIIKFGVCSYMSTFLFAPILSDLIFPATILCTLRHIKLLLSYCTFVVRWTVLSILGYKLLI